jgi:hypothetical protein
MLVILKMSRSILDIDIHSILLLQQLGHVAIETLFEDIYEAHQKHDSQIRKCICLERIVLLL